MHIVILLQPSIKRQIDVQTLLQMLSHSICALVRLELASKRLGSVEPIPHNYSQLRNPAYCENDLSD